MKNVIVFKHKTFFNVANGGMPAKIKLRDY